MLYINGRLVSGRKTVLSQAISENLPFLRRYARALTGSQSSGDAYVIATIEALVRQPDLLNQTNQPKFDQNNHSRAHLFHVFSKIWNSLSVNAGADPAPASPAERRLAQIAALPRQAFLLVSLESFSESEAAYILDTDLAGIRGLISRCGQEMAGQIATNILIIEDEMMIALDLQALVEGLGHRVCGIARTRSEAVDLVKTERPGLVLADIQLADGSSGVDAVKDILDAFEVPVIFITAYPERFLTGARPEPAFLINKPYQPAMVSAVVSQALFFDHKASNVQRRAAG